MSEEHYTTPPGVDERIIEVPEGDFKDALDKAGLQLENWNGFKILRGPKGSNIGPDYFNTLQNRQTHEESIILICTGSPGKGKTYHALRLAEIFDSDFDVTLQVCFTREQILYLIGADSPLKRGQVIIIDEAHFGLGSRSWYEEVQKMLVNNVAAIRSKGLFVIIVALHLDMMDKVIRKYVLSFMHHLEKRGLATIYELYTPRFESEMRRKRISQISLKLPGADGCNAPSCLSCKHSGVIQKQWVKRDKWDEEGYECCNSIRAIYERNKKMFIDSETGKAEAKEKEKTRQDSTPTNDELMPMIMEHKDKLYFNKQGNIDRSSIQDIVADMGFSVGHSIAGEIGKRMMRKYNAELTQLLEDRKAAQTT